MKETYENLDLAVIQFEGADVITESDSLPKEGP